MGSAKSKALNFPEDLSIPSFQVIVMDANMGCNTCRKRVFELLSKINGLKEYTVDVSKNQVIIKGGVRFLCKRSSNM